MNMHKNNICDSELSNWQAVLFLALLLVLGAAGGLGLRAVYISMKNTANESQIRADERDIVEVCGWKGCHLPAKCVGYYLLPPTPPNASGTIKLLWVCKHHHLSETPVAGN